jgi:hypothetical protein
LEILIGDEQLKILIDDEQSEILIDVKSGENARRLSPLQGTVLG